MQTTLAGRFLAFTMLAGLLTAFLLIPTEAVAGDNPSQAADQELVLLGDAFLSHANGTELNLFSAVPEPFAPTELLGPSGCASRTCETGFTITGCCGAHKMSGTDSSGACSVHVFRCPPRG
jgi:hypothetical protein